MSAKNILTIGAIVWLAVLSGFVDVKQLNQPAYRVHTLEVYVENNGQWQMTAHQSVRINPPGGKK